jgi:hypothetical protein
VLKGYGIILQRIQVSKYCENAKKLFETFAKNRTGFRVSGGGRKSTVADHEKTAVAKILEARGKVKEGKKERFSLAQLRLVLGGGEQSCSEYVALNFLRRYKMRLKVATIREVVPLAVFLGAFGSFSSLLRKQIVWNNPCEGERPQTC